MPHLGGAQSGKISLICQSNRYGAADQKLVHIVTKMSDIGQDYVIPLRCGNPGLPIGGGDQGGSGSSRRHVYRCSAGLRAELGLNGGHAGSKTL